MAPTSQVGRVGARGTMPLASRNVVGPKTLWFFLFLILWHVLNRAVEA